MKKVHYVGKIATEPTEMSPAGDYILTLLHALQGTAWQELVQLWDNLHAHLPQEQKPKLAPFVHVTKIRQTDLRTMNEPVHCRWTKKYLAKENVLKDIILEGEVKVEWAGSDREKGRRWRATMYNAKVSPRSKSQNVLIKYECSRRGCSECSDAGIRFIECPDSGDWINPRYSVRASAAADKIHKRQQSGGKY